ncbi:4-hydroxy-tetrahydrodipicolinate synthase [Candidatus Jidaibacter acanthamoeba]|uniref:4-hydroxy-tetrahydrodipicolinate synthase n=1 Tax=Candidatus Jidaibacter acanthamoebae TaxID=86105 RepID=A0A0C1MQA8_9RICK|nr:4-hydroxy-tetrahydrodipicolinate synthase [Candidatus Jidaibacter acanthamoeba]KIE04147.1 4-hydroxy-tetrahydrodipicolinate synthase [Candidatus Jidaibacter acanthamoeba]
MFKGLLTALITPFIKGEVDYESFARFLRWQIKSKVHGLVVLGSTGEGATIGDEERTALIKLSRKEIDNSGTKIPLIVATGSNSTIKTLQYTEKAKELGADAALIVCPYYNKPSQQGMYEHFKYINDSINLPIFVYNVPGRTIVNINNETIAKLAELKNIVGIKDATGDLSRPLSLKAMLSDNDFLQLSGEDATSAAFNLNGGKGCISIIGNIFPEAMSNIQNLTLSGQYAEAVKELEKYQKIIDLMYCETNPIPVKYAAFRMGLISTPELRLPLLTLTHPNCIKIDNELKALGVI